MGYFENTFGSLGRWIDSVGEAVRDKLHRSRSPRPRRSPGEWLGEQSAKAAEKVENAKRAWSLAPDDQRRRWTMAGVIAASVLLGSGAGYAVYRLNGGPNAISSSDAAAVSAVEKRIKDSESTNSASRLFPGAR